MKESKPSNLPVIATIIAALIGASATIYAVMLKNNLENEKLQIEKPIIKSEEKLPFINEYYPLKDGNKWTYKKYDEKETFTGSYVKMSVEDMPMSSKNQPYRDYSLTERDSDIHMVVGSTLRINKIGDIVLSYIHRAAADYLILPGKNNKKYWSGQGANYKIDTDLGSVTLHNGQSFENCISVTRESGDGRFKEIRFYCKKIGVVRVKKYYEGELSGEEQLYKYTLN